MVSYAAKKISPKEAECTIFTLQEFFDDADPIRLYVLGKMYQINTEDDRHILLSDWSGEKHLETAEAEDITEEVVELSNLAVSGKDEVLLAMQLVPTADENDTSP